MKKVSLSTILFLLGCFIAVLAAGLQWIIPGNQLFLSILAVGGVALAAWQKFRGDHEMASLLVGANKTASGSYCSCRNCTHGGHRVGFRSSLVQRDRLRWV